MIVYKRIINEFSDFQKFYIKSNENPNVSSNENPNASSNASSNESSNESTQSTENLQNVQNDLHKFDLVRYNLKKFSDIISNFSYKIYVINSSITLFKASVNFIYKKQEYDILINYNGNYPFSSPEKVEINGINLLKKFNTISQQNIDLLFNRCLCCETILCSNNWSPNRKIEHILIEILKAIDYNDLYIKRILLNKICTKYTNQHLDFLHEYLL